MYNMVDCSIFMSQITMYKLNIKKIVFPENTCIYMYNMYSFYQRCYVLSAPAPWYFQFKTLINMLFKICLLILKDLPWWSRDHVQVYVVHGVTHNY